MAEIRLQEYTVKIKELIRLKQHDQAIAHCQHILRHYPRHLESYSLLGQACQAKGMVREAIEFFQRTLSADPENLIARIGLGLVYGEQGALLEAIWQIERAFELAPGNSEVRRELQRLYAQRDGIEKPRLKLTRGALARLYSRNGLYEQAIAEFYAILRQDPELPDIQLGLLEALWREGRRLEAVEVCLDLLQALPNCLKANLILGEIWLHGGHEEAGQEKLEIARSLDPENLMAQELFGQESPLPPEKLLLEELQLGDTRPGLLGAARERAAAPEARRADLETEQVGGLESSWESGEEIPYWLRDMTADAGDEGAAGELLAQGAAERTSGEPIPEWLQDLMGERQEAAPGADAPVLEGVPEADLALPTVPDWPEDLENAETEELLADTTAAEEPAAAAAEGAVSPGAEEGAELPEWLNELGVPRRDVLLGGGGLPEEGLEDLPDWLRSLRAEGEGLTTTPPVVSPEEEEQPDWQHEVQASAAQDLAVPDAEATAPEHTEEDLDELPAWLLELDLEEVPGDAGEESGPPAETPEAEVALPAEEDVPAWLLALGMAGTQVVAEAAVEEDLGPIRHLDAEGVEAAAPALEEEIEALAAEEELESLAAEAEVGAVAAAIAGEVVPTAPAPAEIPESLRALVEAGILAEEDLAEAMAQMSPEELEVQRAEAVPEWLQELLGEGGAVTPAPEEAVAEPLEEELPDWLKAPGVAEAEAPGAEKVPEAGEIPEWLAAPELTEAEAPVAEVEEEVEAPAEEEEPEAEEIPEWLAALDLPEAEAPAEEEEPEAEEIPEWLAAPDLPEVEAPAEEEEPEAEEIPEWLATSELPEAEAPAEEEAPEAEEISEWLATPELPEAEAPAEEEEPEAEEIPEWLAALDLPEAEAPAEEVEEAVEVPVAESPVGEVEKVVEAPAAEEIAPSEVPAKPVTAEAAPEEEEKAPGRRLQELRDELQAWPRHQLRLEVARLSAEQGEWPSALGEYEKLIAARKFLPDVIKDLLSLAEEKVERSRVYQMLGDAYVQEDQLDQALDMYRRSRQALLKR